MADTYNIGRECIITKEKYKEAANGRNRKVLKHSIFKSTYF